MRFASTLVVPSNLIVLLWGQCATNTQRPVDDGAPVCWSKTQPRTRVSYSASLHTVRICSNQHALCWYFGGTFRSYSAAACCCCGDTLRPLGSMHPLQHKVQSRTISEKYTASSASAGQMGLLDAPVASNTKPNDVHLQLQSSGWMSRIRWACLMTTYLGWDGLEGRKQACLALPTRCVADLTSGPVQGHALVHLGLHTMKFGSTAKVLAQRVLKY